MSSNYPIKKHQKYIIIMLFSAKIFIFCCLLVTIIFLIYLSVREPFSSAEPLKTEPTINDTRGMKYILQWTSSRNVPFVYMGVGREVFTSRNCPNTNCIVTSDRNYLGDLTKFDVIAFAGPEVIHIPNIFLPKVRSPKQKYVFCSIESSHYYPICSNRLDGFFNWTWTFRLDSEVRWGYMLIRNRNNNVIGPKKNMHWKKLEEMEPVSAEFKEKIANKTKAAAWFVSNCRDKSGRRSYAKDLKKNIMKYELDLDIYGDCGTLSCSRNKKEECDKLLDNTYYFYLSFENSFSEDYVTEKLLRALQNNVVPIVYGAANYTRFMPDGIYLNARELEPKELAAKMHELMNDPERYANFFRWKKYYSYHALHESPETDEYCRFCAILNDEEMVNRTTVVENFRDWWDNPTFCFANALACKPVLFTYLLLLIISLGYF